MNRLEREEFTRLSFVPLWGVLGFQAGFINAFGFLACGRFVSHVTGFGTQIGVAMADGNLLFAMEMIGFPLSFIAGSFANGMLTGARLERGKRPRFDVATALIPIFIILLMMLGQKGWFGPFGEEFTHQRDFALLFGLSFLCGLQNGCFAVLTKGQIRTTHLTGMSTDIGTDLARILLGKLHPHELSLTRMTNVCRFTTFGAFAFGSVASVAASRLWDYGALAAPLITSIGAFFAVRSIGWSQFAEGLAEAAGRTDGITRANSH